MPIREENGFAFSAEETLALITPQTRLLILNSPANPTGGVTPRAEVDKLVEGPRGAGRRSPIMSDEIYDGMTYDGEEHVSLLTYPEIRDRLILLNGFSKTWAMTGWRLGWSIWPDGLYDKVQEARRQLLVLRQRADAICRHRRDRWPAGRGRQMVAAFDRRRRGRDGAAEHASRRFLHHAEGRLLRLPERLARPAGRRRRSPTRCSTMPASR